MVAHIHRDPPDLVVHAGDGSLGGAVVEGDLAFARRRLDDLDVRWRIIPGNHDIGDVAGGHEPADERRRQRYESLFGAGSWVDDVGPWRVVGIDVQTLCSGLGSAADVWALLTEAMDPGRPTVLVLHRPLRPPASGEEDLTHRFVPPNSRQRLAGVLAAGDVRTVVSGHTHQPRPFTRSPLRWAR